VGGVARSLVAALRLVAPLSWPLQPCEQADAVDTDIDAGAA